MEYKTRSKPARARRQGREKGVVASSKKATVNNSTIQKHLEGTAAYFVMSDLFANTWRSAESDLFS